MEVEDMAVYVQCLEKCAPAIHAEIMESVAIAKAAYLEWVVDFGKAFTGGEELDPEGERFLADFAAAWVQQPNVRGIPATIAGRLTRAAFDGTRPGRQIKAVPTEGGDNG